MIELISGHRPTGSAAKDAAESAAVVSVVIDHASMDPVA
jgi:hypothetical protein